MNPELITTLQAHIGMPLTPELAARIAVVADRLPTLISQEDIATIEPGGYREFTFAVESMEDISNEMKPLHQAHWDETEEHSHGLPFNMDYATFVRYERAGRFILFTLRDGPELLGNCAMYVTTSTHTQTLVATEDTLFLMPEARKGRTAARFIEYAENALRQLGVREVMVSVKMVNKAARFFQMVGYKQTEIGLSKMLEN